MRLPLLLLPAVLLFATSHAQNVGDSGQSAPTRRIAFLRGAIAPSAASPDGFVVYQTAHNQGRIQLTVSNSGRFGVPRVPDYPHIPVKDPLTNANIQRCTYPAGQDHAFMLDSYFWIGAARDGDTAVVDEEWMPDESEFRPFGYESNSRALTNIYSPSARSELDILCAYTDTTRDRNMVPTNHIPTMLKIKQRSMAWGGAGADDFVLVECELQNLGAATLRKIWFGITFNNEVRNISEVETSDNSYTRFLTGFLPYDVVPRSCLDPERLDMAYVMSADARPFIKQWTKYSALAAVGVRIIAAPLDSIRPNYNWETYTDNGWYSPRLRGTAQDPFRTYGYWGPWNNRGQLYHFLSHKEIDYDQMFAAVNHYWDGWFLPAGNAADLASGDYAYATISAGGFDLAPGASTRLVYAIVGGDSVHVEPTSYDRLFSPGSPNFFYQSLDFSALASNARWAGRIYDNPGVDTDGDGYAGAYEVCDGDTAWYVGDGVPDFKADAPPPAPVVKVIPEQGRLIIRWNGFFSETTADPFTRVVDFEGYNAYVGLDSRPSSLTLYRSYDKPDYVRYRLIKYAVGSYEWRATDLPFTLDSLRSLYGDSSFEPLVYDRLHPLEIDSVFYYFEAQGFNASTMSPQGMHKVYPDAVRPVNDSLLWTDDEVTTEHGRRLPRYYEYEYIAEDLLPTVEYFVNVTAFDFGYAISGLAGQESSKSEGIINAWAMPSSVIAQEEKLAVYCWPNPYRFDGDYEAQGYENRKQDLWYDRAHRIHFANLPPVCKIHIYSLDGDLVRTIDHNFAPDDPEAAHASWDLVTRNIQLAVSGIYYWVVESATGNQIGKLVIIE